MIEIKPSERYAYKTKSQIPNTQQEIERALRRYGAEDIQWASLSNADGNTAILRVLIPPLSEADVPTPLEWRVTWSDDDKAEGRRLWRVMLLGIKARLEEVASGSPISVAFMPNVMLGSGGTLGEAHHARLLKDGAMPTALPALSVGGGA